MRKIAGWTVVFLISALILGQIAAFAKPPCLRAGDDSFPAKFNTAITFTKADLLANDTDSANHAIVFDQIIAQPAQGTLTLNGDTFLYVPEEDSTQSQKFTYSINAALGGETAVATVTIDISEPIGHDDRFTVLTGVAKVIDVLANDEGLQLEIERVYNGPWHGTFDPATLTYTPDAGFAGTDSLKYKLSHADNGNPTDVVIDVAAKPILTLNAVVSGGTLAQVQPTVTDSANANRGPASITIVDGRGTGTSTLDAGQYTVNANAPAGFSAVISGSAAADGLLNAQLDGNYAVIITYTYTVQTPTTGTVTVHTDKIGGPVTSFQPSVGGTPVTIAANDQADVTDVEAGSYLVTANAPAGYTAVITGADELRNVIVTAGQRATVTITYTYTTKGTVTVHTDKIGGPVTSFQPSVGSTPITIPANDQADVTDVEAGNYLVTANAPAGYTAVITGVDATENVTVAAGGTTTVTIAYTYTTQPPVVPQNTPPMALNDTATTTAGGSVVITLLANDTDADGDVLLVSITSQPSNGTVTIADGKITYTPNAGFTGEDSFTYTISDGRGGTSTATVKVTVAAKTPSEPPVIVIDEPIPGGGTTLPKTGGADPILFYGIGLAAVVLGAALRKRNDEE